MTLTFYDCSTAPSPRRAKIALLEKGLDFDTIEIDLRSGEQMGEAFRAINPQCTVPALKLDDGTVLTDNHGILAWLEAAHPEPPLLGTTPIEKADVMSWVTRCEFEGLLAVAEVVRNFAPQMKGRALTGPVDFDQIPALVERGIKRIAAFWDVLEERLDDREYVAGDHFSAADITALVAVDFSKVARQRPGEDKTNIWRWREAMNARESVAATNFA
ncbi:glutathione S-transferase family protein [Parvularcula lutaonensis]|uniref:Glutathione S-transferase family protein n=1 Tax=Parvularcula lutaonensis TaxID=491923 RepID=A0ABV7MBP6_9PROT|nr:glutathione S-transferase family protein [Parvularcula lutaonensis]GGY48926.1 glutathione S-transferase [Parvularcula lutaonensis]